MLGAPAIMLGAPSNTLNCFTKAQLFSAESPAGPRNSLEEQINETNDACY